MLKNFCAAAALLAMAYCPTAVAMEAIPHGSTACFEVKPFMETMKEAGYRQVFGGTFENDEGKRSFSILIGPGHKWFGLIYFGGHVCPIFTGQTIREARGQPT